MKYMYLTSNVPFHFGDWRHTMTQMQRKMVVGKPSQMTITPNSTVPSKTIEDAIGSFQSKAACLMQRMNKGLKRSLVLQYAVDSVLSQGQPITSVGRSSWHILKVKCYCLTHHVRLRGNVQLLRLHLTLARNIATATLQIVIRAQRLKCQSVTAMLLDRGPSNSKSQYGRT
jgi:hypothetical protein